MAGGDTRKVLLKNKDGEYLIPYTELASSTTAGRVKPDNSTVEVESDGTLKVKGFPSTILYGASLSMSINSSTYVITLQLKDQNGNSLGTAQTVDLPLESVVVNGSYDNTNKRIVLTLQSGDTVNIPVGDLVSGLQETLVSGMNIKTVNGNSLLGSGNIVIEGGLPSQTGQSGKFLTADGTNASWASVSGADVDAYTSAEIQTLWESVNG